MKNIPCQSMAGKREYGFKIFVSELMKLDEISMSHKLSNLRPNIPAPLDVGFLPAAIFNQYYTAMVRAARHSLPLVIGLERENGFISRHETQVLPGTDAETLRYVERLVKFLLWAHGGWRLWIGGPLEIGLHIQRCYNKTGERRFDTELMSRVYERSFEVVITDSDSVPSADEMNAPLGGNLNGCRIGFDLGASDFKVSAINEGKVLFSREFPWNPTVEPDPDYHYRCIEMGLREAAKHLPRVDAIGGSSAGIIVDNKIMVASLFRAVPTEKFESAKNIFLRLQQNWKVPLQVANDGDVTALAGAMSLKVSGILGIAMGSSEAAGYLNSYGCITGQLNELAFAPVNYSAQAAPDEWSGDLGLGVLAFSQQAVNKLLPAAQINLPPEMSLPERLEKIQDLMKVGDSRAVQIYETIGVYLGYTIPHYAQFYDFQHMLILGRVTSGAGGEIILSKARDVLESQFPEIAQAVRLHVPDESSRRVGQAVAAASLPALE